MKKNALFKLQVLLSKYLFICVLLFSGVIYSQTTPSVSIEKSRTISGFINYDKSPLAGVNITVKESGEGAISDSKGYYSINANVGELIQFSYVGMKTISILVEDVTSTLNIEMKTFNYELEEIKLKSKKRKETEKYFTTTERGIRIDRRSSNYISADKLNPAAGTLANALRGKVPGMKVVRDPATLQDQIFLRGRAPALWEIDGSLFYFNPPSLNPALVESVVILRSLSETTQYGTDGANGVIIVTTKAAAIKKRKKEDSYTNKDIYANDAIDLENLQYTKPNYLNELHEILSPEIAFNKYLKISNDHKYKSNFHLTMVNHFVNVYNDKNFASKILNDYKEYANNNPEILKTIAYKYQELGFHQEAIEVYKDLMRIRPKHVQSFRDLGNAYSELKEYQKAWKIYRYYLQKGFSLEQNAIGEVMASEMTALYMSKRKEAKIKEKMAVDTTVNITNDVRIVIEWNTSEAEFVLEFANPDKQVFTVDHSLEENNDLIIDEKKKGYNSKEFIIEDLMEGNWLMNLTYLGNKKFEPTYFKVSTYYNWARSNQSVDIRVYELLIKDTKVKLLELNKKMIN